MCSSDLIFKFSWVFMIARENGILDPHMLTPDANCREPSPACNADHHFLTLRYLLTIRGCMLGNAIHTWKREPLQPAPAHPNARELWFRDGHSHRAGYSLASAAIAQSPFSFLCSSPFLSIFVGHRSSSFASRVKRIRHAYNPRSLEAGFARSRERALRL